MAPHVTAQPPITPAAQAQRHVRGGGHRLPRTPAAQARRHVRGGGGAACPAPQQRKPGGTCEGGRHLPRTPAARGAACMRQQPPLHPALGELHVLRRSPKQTLREGGCWCRVAAAVSACMGGAADAGQQSPSDPAWRPTWGHRVPAKLTHLLKSAKESSPAELRLPLSGPTCPVTGVLSELREKPMQTDRVSSKPIEFGSGAKLRAVREQADLSSPRPRSDRPRSSATAVSLKEGGGAGPGASATTKSASERRPEEHRWVEGCAKAC
jgi:hypothetical protein